MECAHLQHIVVFGPIVFHRQVKKMIIEEKLQTLEVVTIFDQSKSQGVSGFQSLYILRTKMIYCLSKNISVQRQGLVFPVLLGEANREEIPRGLAACKTLASKKGICGLAGLRSWRRLHITGRQLQKTNVAIDKKQPASSSASLTAPKKHSKVALRCYTSIYHHAAQSDRARPAPPAQISSPDAATGRTPPQRLRST